MSDYHGRLWVSADPDNAVEGIIELIGDRIVVKAAGSVLADWDRAEVAVAPSEFGFQLTEGDDVLIFQPRTAGFDHAMGLSTLRERLSAISTTNTSPSVLSVPATPDVRSGADRGNAMAVTAMVLGIVGVVVGVIPILAAIALICGILGLIFGIAGLRKVRLGTSSRGRGMAITGVVLGAIAIVLGIVGFVIVNDAFSEFGDNLDDLGGTGSLAAGIVLNLDTCDGDGAHGTVVNRNDVTVDLAIDAYFFDGSGVQVDSSVGFVSGLRPGGTAVWDAMTFGTDFARCSAELSYVFDS